MGGDACGDDGHGHGGAAEGMAGPDGPDEGRRAEEPGHKRRRRTERKAVAAAGCPIRSAGGGERGRRRRQGRRVACRADWGAKESSEVRRGARGMAGGRYVVDTAVVKQ